MPAGRKAVIQRKPGDLVSTPTRLPEAMRDALKAAAAVNGRSMNAEIIYRLDEHDRVARSYALFSEFPEARRACQIVATLADFLYNSTIAPGIPKEVLPDIIESHLNHAIHEYFTPSRESQGLDTLPGKHAAALAKRRFNPPDEVAAYHLDMADLILAEIEEEESSITQDLLAEMIRSHIQSAEEAVADAAKPLEDVQKRLEVLAQNPVSASNRTPEEIEQAAMREFEAKANAREAAADFWAIMEDHQVEQGDIDMEAFESFIAQQTKSKRV